MPAACELHSWHWLSTASTSHRATLPNSFPFPPASFLSPLPPSISPREKCWTQFGPMRIVLLVTISDDLASISSFLLLRSRPVEFRWPGPWKSSNKSRPDLPRYSRTSERNDDSFCSRKKRLLNSGSFYSMGRLPRLTFSASRRVAVLPSNYTINIRQKWTAVEMNFTYAWTKRLTWFVLFASWDNYAGNISEIRSDYPMCGIMW